MGEVRLLVEEDYLYSEKIISCRICHDSEFESSKTFEAPCSCAGTLKFAHRDCIQRWCDEKGNTICEICLQKFEPGYSGPPPRKPAQLIRGSVQLPETEREVHQEESLLQTQDPQCSSAADTSAAFCRFVGLIFTLVLLVRHLFALLFIGERGDYPFTLFTLLVIRATGILIPMYIIMLAVDAIHNSLRRRYEVSGSERWQHRVDIN